MPYRPGIDGLRALAVGGVVLYHADVSWLPGGFLGVDVFFVISGYLICSLLLAESGRGASVDLRRFWVRRARRLLPALGVVLVATVLGALVIAPDAAARVRGDLPAAVTYVSNWWQIIGGQSYFEEIGRPPLLRHLWSLAVEEQFYLVFPPLLLVGLRMTKGRRGPIAVAAVAVGAASTALMAALWQPGTDPSRVFFGTDTRAVGLCMGVALACVWAPGRLRADVPLSARRLLDAVGALALGALGALALRLGEFDPMLYRGGFVAVALASTVAIAVAVHPATRLGAVLGRQPLKWVGTRSYAIYLWHWPVFMLTRPELDIPLTGFANLCWRLTLTGVLAEVSWRAVEQPFRTGALGRAWQRSSPANRPAFVMAAALPAMVLTAALVIAPTPAPPELLASALASAPSTRVAAGPGAPPTTTPPPSEAASTSAVPDTASPEASTTAQPAAAVAPASPGPAGAASARAAASPPPAGSSLPEGSVLAIGDSVMATARSALNDAAGGHVIIDAVVGRQVDDGLNVLQRHRDAGELAGVSAVVIHLGTNGPMTTRHFERLAQLVEGVPNVVVVNVRVPRRWEAQSNTSIGEGVPHHAAMQLADWYRASEPRGVLANDGVHPTPSGAKVYARLIVDLVHHREPAAPSTTTMPAPEPPPSTEPPPPTQPEPTTTTEPAPTSTTIPG